MAIITVGHSYFFKKKMRLLNPYNINSRYQEININNMRLSMFPQVGV